MFLDVPGSGSKSSFPGRAVALKRSFIKEGNYP